nr:immunoglobulin heavy chain junction region [Macaca mulatta]
SATDAFGSGIDYW